MVIRIRKATGLGYRARSAGPARGSGQPTETPQLSDTAAHQQGLTHALALPVHLGKPEMPHGGWTETVDSTEIDLAATIQRIKDLAAAPH